MGLSAQELSYSRSAAPIISGFGSTSQALMDRAATVGAASAFNETMKNLDTHRVAQSINIDLPKMQVSHASHDGGAAQVANVTGPQQGGRGA